MVELSGLLSKVKRHMELLLLSHPALTFIIILICSSSLFLNPNYFPITDEVEASSVRRHHVLTLLSFLGGYQPA